MIFMMKCVDVAYHDYMEYIWFVNLYNWLVVSTTLKKYESQLGSVGIIIPNMEKSTNQICLS